jgi:excisionase family DNA binding protein
MPGKDFPEPKESEGAPVYLTAGQVAALLQVSIKSVFRWAQQDPTMPALRLGGVVRFPKARLLLWLENHEQGRQRRRRVSGGPNGASPTE